MAGTATPIFPQTMENWAVALTTTTATTLVTGGTNGTKVESIMVASSDTTARDLVLSVNNGSTSFPIGIVSIPITAGTVDTVPSVAIFRSAQLPGLAIDANGNPYLYVASGWSLQVAVATAPTSGKQFTVFAQGGNF
jgi:hypothetical protein